MKYKIRVETSCRTGSENSYSDKPYDGYSHEVYEDHKFIVSTGEAEKWPDATVETDLEDPIFVFVIYSSGGTFGRTDGYNRFIGVIERNLVSKVDDLIWKSTSKKERASAMSALGDTIGEDIYDCWNGYFEHLQDVKFVDKYGFTS
jgi:hypothetical protein